MAGRFGVAESTFHSMMDRVLEFLCDLAPDVIKFPADLDRLAEDFEKASGSDLLYVFTLKMQFNFLTHSIVP